MHAQQLGERGGESEGGNPSSAHLIRLGARLSALRRASGQSQHHVAAALGVAPSSYAGWERAEIGPRFEQLLALADHFAVSLDDLVGRERPSTPLLTSESVRWRLAWSGESVMKEQAADVWHKLMAGRKKAEIAQELGFGDDEVDRLVQNLVLHDWLEVEKVERHKELEQQLFDHLSPRYRLRDIQVAKLGRIDSLYARYVLLGHAAKAFLGTREKSGALRPGGSLGLCGGFSVSRVVYAYRRGELPAGIRVLPIAVTPFYEQAGVSANSVVGALAYRHYKDADEYDDAVEASELSFRPADNSQVSSSPAWQVVESVLEDARHIEVAVMGLGGRTRGSLSRSMSHIQHDYLWATRLDDVPPEPQADLSVGNILYQPIDANGVPQYEDFTRHVVCSIGLDVLHKMVESGRRVVVLGVSAEKAKVALAAIVGGYTNVLVIDDELAQALLAEPLPPLSEEST
jgi:DNA-binding transcriptional regulator LsrR (DeoR family)/DNA-binding XRE family transcriptional regulator